MNVIAFVSKYLNFKAYVAIFADIIKIVTIFIKAIFKNYQNAIYGVIHLWHLQKMTNF